MAKVEGIAKVRVDGQEAGKQLEILEQKARDLRKEIVAIRKQDLVDQKQLKSLQTELKSVDKEMKSIKTTSFQYSNILKNLSGASFNELKKAHSQLNKELSQLNRGTDEYKKKAMSLSAVKAEMTKYRLETSKANKELKESGNGFDRLAGKVKASFAQITVVAASITAVIATLLAFDRKILETSKLQTQIKFLFGETGDALDNLTLKAMNLADRLDADVNETLKAANVFYKEFEKEITASQAFDLIQEAAEKGANTTGELLEILREYPAQLKQVGLDAKESLAVITQQVQSGVFSDKGIDAIKEAGIRIREMTPATKAALEGIGLSSVEIQKGLQDNTKTIFQVIQDVSGRLNEVKDDSPEVGAALADIFGGAGEDAGLRYLKTLKDINVNLDDIETNIDDATKAQNRLNDAWNETILQATKGSGGIGKVFIGFKTYLAETLELVNHFSRGTFIDRLKIMANKAVDVLTIMFKPFLWIIEKITGEDLLMHIKFDIDTESSKQKMNEFQWTASSTQALVTEEEKMQRELRKKLAEQEYQAKIKGNEQMIEIIEGLNLQLIEDAREKNIQEVNNWYDKEQKKIEISKASAALKAQAVEALEKVHAQKLLEIDDKYNQETLKKIDAVQTFLDEQKAKLETDRDEIIQRDIDAITAKYDAQILLAGEHAYLVAELEALKKEEVDAYKLEKEQEFADNVIAIRDQYGLVSEEEKFIEELALLDQHLANKLLSEEQYQKVKKTINDKYIADSVKKQQEAFKKELDLRKKSIQDAQIIINALGDFISAAKEEELLMAGDNEEKKKEIMKKYADKEFVVKAGQIIASTALAIIQALAQLGPVAGAIASGIIGATALIQLSNANRERQRVKGLAEGGDIPVTREQDGRKFNATYGGNKSGLFTRPTVLVAEEGPEYVIPYSGLQNPQISSFVDAIEQSRKAGSLHNFNYQRAISAGSHIKGFAEGGFTSGSSSTASESYKQVIDVLLMVYKGIIDLKSSIDRKYDLLKAYISYDDIEEAINVMTNLKNEVTIE